jgi:type I restriction enzyme, S subunit
VSVRDAPNQVGKVEQLQEPTVLATSQTPYSWLPPQWTRAQLGDLGIAFSGVWGEDLPVDTILDSRSLAAHVLRVSDIADDFTIRYDRAPIRAVTTQQAEKYRLQTGDIVVVKSSGSASRVISGRPAYFETRDDTELFIPSNFTLALRGNPARIDSHFLWYGLLSQRAMDEVHRMAEGSTYPNLKQAEYLTLEIPLPPLPEQRAIANILRTVQDAIQARRRELELERERKAALMQHLFTKGARGEPTKQTEIGEMPVSWQVVRLGDLCSTGRGMIQTGPFGSQLHASDYKPEGIPVINPTHLGFNTIDETHLPRISQEDAAMLSRHCLQVGDILIARRGDFSRYSYISKNQAGWLCGTGCLLIRFHNLDVDNYFVSVSMSTTAVQDYMQQNSVGSIMPNLNTKILEGMPLALPPLEQQNEISDLVRACDANVIALECETTCQEELFRALLEEVMTGRLSALPLAAATGVPS